MDEKQENGGDKFNKALFLLLLLFGIFPEAEREEFLRRIKEIAQGPDESGGD